jgi:hypothetical protein
MISDEVRWRKNRNGRKKRDLGTAGSVEQIRAHREEKQVMDNQRYFIAIVSERLEKPRWITGGSDPSLVEIISEPAWFRSFPALSETCFLHMARKTGETGSLSSAGRFALLRQGQLNFSSLTQIRHASRLEKRFTGATFL